MALFYVVALDFLLNSENIFWVYVPTNNQNDVTILSVRYDDKL